MNDMQRWLSAFALLCASCAAVPSSRPTTAPQTALAPVTAVRAADATIDADAFRRELEDAYQHILTRAQKPVNAPAVDIEAAASIPIPEHRTIRGALSYFSTDLKSDIQTSLIRSARYKTLIEKALDEQELPKGLAYLPVIESAYVPTLTSRAGAHGIWQFMPDTAREYGLRVDWWMDERADPERSTRAAAKYLRDLYRQFNDWPLTLAAYNAGPGRVRRALESDGSTTFWELLEHEALPKETRGYVPTFFATLIIATDPETYGFVLGEPGDLDPDKRVDVDGPVSLKYLAEVAGIDEDQLRAMNPAFRRGIVPPGRASVHLPPKAAEAVLAKARTLRQEDAYVAVCTYRIKAGDSLKKIARAIGTKPETIAAMNNVDSIQDLGRGETIYLPTRARELGTLLAHANDPDIYYKVKKGDTLYSVAKRHNLTVEELRDLNDLSARATLHAGQKLRVSAPRALTAGGM